MEAFLKLQRMHLDFMGRGESSEVSECMRMKKHLY